MQTKTVCTPIQIQLLFLLIIAIGAIGFLFSYQSTHASDYKIIQCQNAFIGVEYNPKLEKQCRNKWTLWTWQIKKSFNNK